MTKIDSLNSTLSTLFYACSKISYERLFKIGMFSSIKDNRIDLCDIYTNIDCNSPALTECTT